MAALVRCCRRATLQATSSAACAPSLLAPPSLDWRRALSSTAVAHKKGKQKEKTFAATTRQLSFVETSGPVAIKTYLPVTPSLRHYRHPVTPHLHKGEPVRALTVAKRSTGARNNHGRITTRARGGGHRRRIRLVDFHRRAPGIHDVVRIEYDPGRSAHIALVKERTSGLVSYILAPASLRQGDTVQSLRSHIPDEFRSKKAATPSEPEGAVDLDPGSPQSILPPGMVLPGLTPSESSSADDAAASAPTPSKREKLSALEVDEGALRLGAIKPGNCLPLRLIPPNTTIFAISLQPSGGAVLARSAGASARLTSFPAPGTHAQIKLASGEVRLVPVDCVATIGECSNDAHSTTKYGKAGRRRWLGFRPQSRGVAMNSRDHPHGGGRGKSKGNKAPVDQWGNSAKGKRTRSPRSKNGNKFVVKERPRKSGGMLRL